MNLKELTVSLCSVMSISGHEGRGEEALRTLVAPYFDEYRADAVGNHLFIKRCGKDNAPVALVDAHFDEIGMIVTDIKEGGFLSVTSIGGLDPSIMQASEVKIYGKETIHGIVASTPPHLVKPEEAKKLKPINELIIDTGYEKEELEKIVSLGTPVGFAPIYRELLNDRIAGKSFDDKACAAAAVFGLHDVKAEELACDVYLLLSCHEETDRLGGVTAAAFGIDPDYALVIDVGFALVPDTKKNECAVMGEGLILTVSAVTSRRLTNMTAELFDKSEIKYTRIVSASHTGTNATPLGLVGRGVPVVDVGLPLKNMHTYTEIIDLKDSETLARAVREFVCSKEIAEVFGR